MPAKTIPSRFKEVHFNAVAKVIGDALRAFPKAIERDPAPLSVETFARKVREGIEAKRRYGYQSEHVDDIAFTRLSDQIRTHMTDNGTVLIGPREAIQQTQEAGKIVAAANAASADNEYEVKPQWIETLCLLLHNRAFSPAPNFVVTSPITQETIDSLESRYEVGFVQAENRTDKYLIVTM